MRRFQLQMIDGKELINFQWKPLNNPKSVIHIVHNIDEHMSMYDEIAKLFVSKDILVIGTDLRGFGESATQEEKAYFDKRQGFNSVIEDLRTVNTFIKREYPDIPIFMLGQTIGADFSLAYAIKYCETLSGLILSGTKNHNKFLTLMNILKVNLTSFVIPKWPTKHLFRNLDNYFSSKDMPSKNNLWLSSDEKVIQEFNDDKLKQTWITHTAYRDILLGQFFTSKLKSINLIDKDFPILILGGEKDAYSNFSKSTRKLFTKFIKIGSNTDLILYNNLRNRLLKDVNGEDVINDINAFINKYKI